jgi:hypothetical protein
MYDLTPSLPVSNGRRLPPVPTTSGLHFPTTTVSGSRGGSNPFEDHRDAEVGGRGLLPFPSTSSSSSNPFADDYIVGSTSTASTSSGTSSPCIMSCFDVLTRSFGVNISPPQRTRELGDNGSHSELRFRFCHHLSIQRAQYELWKQGGLGRTDTNSFCLHFDFSPSCRR